MRNACLFLVALMFLAASGAATVQSASGSPQPTGRDYFNELRDANAFNHYGDEYVCFPDEDEGNFAIVAKSKDIEKMKAAPSGKAGAKPKPLAWIIHKVSSQKRKDALKGMMNTGFRHPAFPFGASIA
jgi:hypothetical protein